MIRFLGGLGWIGAVCMFIRFTLPEVPVPAPRVPLAELDVAPRPDAGVVSKHYDAAIRVAFGDCGDPCIVRGNSGGLVATFLIAAIGFQEGIRAGLVIDGPCASACAITADLAAEKTCITPRAAFGFHRTSAGDEPPQTRELSEFIRAHGGFPSFKSGDFNWMPYRVARMFWQDCPSTAFIRAIKQAK